MSETQKKLYNTFIKNKMYGATGAWCSALNPIKAFSICCKVMKIKRCMKNIYIQGVTIKTPDFDFALICLI